MRYQLTSLLLLFSLISFAQKPISEYDTKQVFGERGEIYFRLENAAVDAEKLTRIVSIDNIKGGDVYAYASVKEFNNLKAKYHYIFYNLLKPGELTVPPMSDSPREVLDWNYYPSYGTYLQIMQDFATNFPDICEIDTIGTSVENRLIIVARISDNVGVEENEPEFLYTSSIHGDETTGYILTLHLIDYLLLNYGIDDRVTNMVNNMDIWINPLANPDGTYAGGNNSVNGATRYNANYIDLNRNYPDPDPYDGPHPDGEEWQPETVAFMNFAESRNLVLSANFHGGAEVANYPWDTWSKLTADDAWWKFVSREYADTVHANAPTGYFTDLQNGITNGYGWYTITGGRQDYMNYFQQCREVTLEVSATKLLPVNQLLNYWNYNYRSMLNYMEQAQYGVRGIISDTITGEPLKAQILISGHDVDSSMVFSSLPVGNYHRLITAGTYNITFFAEGYLPKTVKNVVVDKKETTILNVRLWDGTPIPGIVSSDTLIAPNGTIQFNDVSGGAPNSRLWTFEGGVPSTSTEINPVVTYTQEGAFNVTLLVSNIIGSNTLVLEDYITVQEGVGVKIHQVQEITIYPNPVVNSSIYIQSDELLTGYSLTDLTGKSLIENTLSGNNTLIDLTSVNRGIYLLKVQNSKGIKIFKVILNR